VPRFARKGAAIAKMRACAAIALACAAAAQAPPDPRELSECAEVLVQAGILAGYNPANNSVLR
jgi:hypothetical protein